MFEKLGKFQIKRLLGQGAMGEVYLGIDPAIGREVAIKTIIPTAAQGDEAKARFEREARAAGVLNHPHLVTIYEFGEDQGVLFIAMEYVRGQDLEEMFREQSLSRSEALEVLAQVCDGLNFAHRNGIVHRDIKPSNVRVTRDGKRLHAKVMDFGVARVSNSEMTATGMVMGTVSYMAPEYIRTGKPDPRSDLFAVGVMLYEVLSGRKPFSGETTPTILYKIVNEPPDPIDLHSLAGISPAIRLVLDRSLAKDPEIRFQTAEDLARALRAAKDPTWQGEAEQATSRIAAGAVTAPVPEHAVPPAPPAHPTIQVATAAPAAPKKSKAGLFLVAGLAGAALLGGGAYGTYHVLTKPASPASDAPPQTVTPAQEAQPAAAPKVQPAPVPAQQLAQPPSQAPEPTSAPTTAPAVPAPVAKPVPQPQPPAREPVREAPRPAPAPDPYEKMDVSERKAASNMSLSEAIQLADKDPRKAVEGMKAAMDANPGNPAPYAWAVAILYETGRYSEIPAVLAKARRNGISRGQLATNIRFRMAMQRDAMNRKIPGGAEGDE